MCISREDAGKVRHLVDGQMVPIPAAVGASTAASDLSASTGMISAQKVVELLESAESELSHELDRSRRTTSQIRQLENDNDALLLENEKVRSETQRMQSRLQSLQMELDAERTLRQSADALLQEYRNDLEGMAHVLQEQETEISMLHSQVHVLESESGDLRRNLQSSQEGLAGLEQQAKVTSAASSHTCRTLKSTLEEKESEIRLVRIERDELKRQVEGHALQVEHWKKVGDVCRQVIDERDRLLADRDRLQSSCSDLQNFLDDKSTELERTHKQYQQIILSMESGHLQSNTSPDTGTLPSLLRLPGTRRPMPSSYSGLATARRKLVEDEHGLSQPFVPEAHQSYPGSDVSPGLGRSPDKAASPLTTTTAPPFSAGERLAQRIRQDIAVQQATTAVHQAVDSAHADKDRASPAPRKRFVSFDDWQREAGRR